jgi:hypothetical protein
MLLKPFPLPLSTWTRPSRYSKARKRKRREQVELQVLISPSYVKF